MGGVTDFVGGIFGGGPDIPNIGPARQVDLLEWGGNIDPTAIPESFGGQQLSQAYQQGGQLQNEALQNAINQQGLGFQGAQQLFNETQQNFNPFIEGGTAAFNQQAALSGALGGAAQQGAYDQIQASPAQQFIRDRANKALLRDSAVTGDLGGGRTRQGLQEQAMGFAMQDVDNQFNRLGSLAGTGAQMASGLGGLASQLGQSGLGVSSNISNAMTQQGQNLAQAGLGSAGAMQQEIQQQYGAGLDQFQQLQQQQAAQNQFNLSQQGVDLSNIQNQLGVDQVNASIAAQNAANDAAGMGNLLQLGGTVAGFALGGPMGASIGSSLGGAMGGGGAAGGGGMSFSNPNADLFALNLASGSSPMNNMGANNSQTRTVWEDNFFS